MLETQEKATETRPRRPGLGRKINVGDVAFAMDGEPAERPITGILTIQSGVDAEGRGYCRVETIDIDAARALPIGDSGRLYARFNDWQTAAPEAERTCLGQFRVAAPPLYNAGARQVASAIIRFAE